MKTKKTTSIIITVVLTIASLFSTLFPRTVSAAIAINELTQGACTSDPCSTASITPTAGSVVYIAVAVATNSDGGTNPTDSITISGNGLTWTKVETILYGSRRRLWVYRGTGTASAGAITMDYWGGSIYNETMWSVDEFTGVDSTTPNDAATTAAVLSGTSLAVGDVGTPDTGDVIYGAFAMSVANDNLAPESGFTALTQIQNGANVRALLTEYDATATLDETPGSIWNTAVSGGNGAGGIGFIINMAIPATTEQEGFRFRNDDGSETTATWLADQDINITRDKDLTTRLRFLVDSVGDLAAAQYQLEWRKMGGGDIISDDFNRSDGDSLGTNWAEAYNDQDIVSNRLNLKTGGYVKNQPIYSGSATASTDQYVKVAMYSTGCGGGDYPEIAFRYTNSASPYYAVEFNVNADTALWRRYPTVAGSSADISASTAMTITTGDVLGVTVSGTGDNTVVRIWRNPTGDSPNSASNWGGDTSPDITFTDNPASPVDSGSYTGIGGYQSASDCISFDNFFAGDVYGGISWNIATTTIGSDITIVGSANIGASGANTTAQLAPPAGKATSDFVAGRIQDDENPTDSVNITTDDYTEFEWSIVATSTTVTGNVFQFRITSGDVPFSLYARTPQWTIGTAPSANPGNIISRFLIRWGAIKVNNGRIIIK